MKIVGKLTNDFNEYVAEILKMLKDDEYYLKKSIHAKEKANELNNIDYYIENLNNIYVKK